MGWRNVNRALAAPVERVFPHYLLVAMASAANDKDNPPKYYGTVDWLAMIARTDRRHIQRVLRTMEKDGWISPDGYRNGRRVWTLHLPRM